MKTLIQSLLVAVSVSVATMSASLAATKPNRPAVVSAYQTSMYTTAEGKLSIALDKEVGGKVIVRLTNSTGKVYFEEYVGKHKKVARLRLDVSGLPDGAYKVEITNGVNTTTHALTLATQQPSVTSRLIAIN